MKFPSGNFGRNLHRLLYQFDSVPFWCTGHYAVVSRLIRHLLSAERKREKIVAYAMERVAAGAHFSTPWLFEPAKRPVKTDYCLGSVSSRSANTRDSFLQLSGLRCALQSRLGVNSGEGRPSEYSQRTGPRIIELSISLPKGKQHGSSWVRSWDLWSQSRYTKLAPVYLDSWASFHFTFEIERIDPICSIIG